VGELFVLSGLTFFFFLPVAFATGASFVMYARYCGGLYFFACFFYAIAVFFYAFACL
jgi:hypothetical protein